MCVSREKTTFRRFVVNDAYIQKPLMIDTVHDHECLIFLFGFNVQFVSNLFVWLHTSCVVVCFAYGFYVYKV